MYGLWYIGQGNDGSSMTKSFLNCDAIPFSGKSVEKHRKNVDQITK